MQKIGMILKWHINSHRVAYFIMLIIFTIGFIVGAVNSAYLKNDIKQESMNYIEMFIESFKTEKIDKSILLKEAVVANLKPLVIIWVLGLVIIGVPLIFMYIGFYGYSIGFTISLVLNTVGVLKGSIFVLLALIPQEIVLIPVIFFVSLNGIIFSNMIGTMLKSNFKRNVITYSVIFGISGVIVILVSLFQVYVIGNVFK